MEPLKWQKYVLLTVFGLAREEELSQDIQRFSWQHRYDLLEALTREVSSHAGGAYLIVVKLVTADSVGQLENIRVSAASHLRRVERAFRSRNPRVTEVWACRTTFAQGGVNTAGRLAVFGALSPFGQCLEQVSRCSPRLLESHGDPGFAYPYVRATRPWWGRSYTVDEVLLPRGWRRRRSLVLSEFTETATAIEREREKLEEFSTFIEDCGQRSFSFEYKYTSGRLRIIDWDTASDREVLRYATDRGLLSVL